MTTEYSWSDLPDDLLHLVYTKVVGLLQRVRFAAVCTSWRDAAIHAAPPALPWHFSALQFDGNGGRTKRVRVYCPEDGKVLRIRVPIKATVERFVGAHDGGWIAALTRKHVNLVVFNLFSGVEVPLSVKQRKFVPTSHRDGPCAIRKIVFSEAPTSSDCILVARACTSGVALCRVGCCLEDDEWIRRQGQYWFTDIAFCNGALYGLTTSSELLRFDITTDKDNAISVVVTQLLSVQPEAQGFGYWIENPSPWADFSYRNHLLDLGGKLAMATTCLPGRANTIPSFEVFELTAYDRQGKTLKLAEVTSLDEHALFLGDTCSKAVRVPAGGRGWVERNSIYGANAFYFDGNRGRHYNENQNEKQGEGVSRFKVAGHYMAMVPQEGMWIIPPSV